MIHHHHHHIQHLFASPLRLCNAIYVYRQATLTTWMKIRNWIKTNLNNNKKLMLIVTDCLWLLRCISCIKLLLLAGAHCGIKDRDRDAIAQTETTISHNNAPIPRMMNDQPVILHPQSASHIASNVLNKHNFLLQTIILWLFFPYTYNKVTSSLLKALSRFMITPLLLLFV